MSQESVAYLLDQAISVEAVLARERVKLSGQELLSARAALLARLDDHEAVVELGDVGLDGLSGARRLGHVLLQALYVRRVVFERRADLLLEVVDHDKVGEEGQDVLDLEQTRRLEELHRAARGIEGISETLRRREPPQHARLDVVLLPDDMFRNLEPQLLPQEVIVFRFVGADLGKFEIVVLERKVHARFVQRHLRVDHDAGLHALVRAGDPKGVIEIEVWVVRMRICRRRLEEANEACLIG